MRVVNYLFAIIISVTSGYCRGEDSLVKVNGKNFTINGKPYYYIGANYWYGAILASTGTGGNRERLLKELDAMKELGIDNLRILAGAEGPNDEPSRVTPALQIAPGKYDEALLDGLDFLLSEMKKRGQYAILYLNNPWDWSGGYAQYLNWNGFGPIPYPNVKPNTWPQFINYISRFFSCGNCMKQYQAHIAFMLARTNKYTGLKYTDDPTIMTWEIANEPRAFSNENIPAFEKWIRETAAYIKSLDRNHLVTTGTEGQHGCEESIELFERIHADPHIDYLTMHIWPKNWSWLNAKDIPGTLEISIQNTNDYMQSHFEIARKLNKPIVLEEFGLPRDLHGYSPGESTLCRDKYYQHAFEQVYQHAIKKDVLAGCNFWAYSGCGRPAPDHIFWQKGDDYLGDPPQEEQGLNSVFDTDSTIPLIRTYNNKIRDILPTADQAPTQETRNLRDNLVKLMAKGIMFGHQDDLAYGVGWSYQEGQSDVKRVCSDYPAVYGWDLGRLERGEQFNLDAVPFNNIRRYITEVYTRGGVNVVSWHADNPLTGGSAWDVTSSNVVSSILPGGPENELFKQWLDRLAAFFLSLKDEKGILVPIVFRPYHEHNGSWFWWGQNLCSTGEYIRLWQYTVDYLRYQKGVHNLLYAYSNTAEFTGKDEYLARYPGDAYIDVLGFDCYQSDNNSVNFIDMTRQKLNVLCRVAQEKNKIPALTEMGYERIPYVKWWTKILWPILENNNISYVLCWRNAYDKPDHYYVPYAGHPSAADFINFYHLPQTLFQNDVTKEELYK